MMSIPSLGLLLRGQLCRVPRYFFYSILWGPLFVVDPARAQTSPPSSQAFTGASSSAEVLSLPTGVESWDSYIPETNPYLPQNTDYALELGSTWEDGSLYWTGATIGLNSGECWGNLASSCQRYLTLSAGVAGREGYTHGLSFGGIRWQFVEIPRNYSPFIGAFAGVMNSNVPGSVSQTAVWGINSGLFLYLHEAADLKLEGRIGKGRQPFAQLLVAAQLKLDHWVEHFVIKVKNLGIDTARRTTEAVVKTVSHPGEAIGTVIEASKNVIKKTGEATEEKPE